MDAGYTSSADKIVTDEDQAAYYDQIMGTLMQSKAKGTKITGLVIWSLYDGVSWRASSVPCLFNGLFSPKSAFFAVVDAKNHQKIMRTVKSFPNFHFNYQRKTTLDLTHVYRYNNKKVSKAMVQT